MGRHVGKKLERKEKSKVKLKAKNAGITKAKNVTDTSFKAHKILIREQLKSKDMDVPYSKRKLTVKELLSRLQHHNLSVRKSALVDLKEMVQSKQKEEILGLYLWKILEGLAKLVLDQEREVRKTAMKLLGEILEQVETQKLSPFFKMLLSYLGCGMTHIHPNIQEDSLLMLEVLLKQAPSLVAENASQILPNFLNMISRMKSESKPERTLTMNLGSKHVSMQWRFNVLCHMHTLLTAMVQHFKRESHVEDAKSCKMYFWKQDKPLYLPLYKSQYLKMCRLSDATHSSEDISYSSNSDKLKNFADVIMPLLKEIWLEALPSSSEQISALSVDSALLLKCIVELIHLLWELLCLWEKRIGSKSLSTEFAAAYRKDFEKHFLRDFPYTKSVTAVDDWNKFKDKKQQQMKQSTNSLTMLWKEKLFDENCSDINLTLCSLFCSLHDTKNPPADICARIVEYVKRYINLLKRNPQDVYTGLISLIQALLIEHSKAWEQLGVDFASLMDILLMCSEQIKFSDAVFDQLTQILCEIGTSENLSHLFRSEKLLKWVCFLPDVLLRPTIHISVLKSIVKFAYQSHKFAAKLHHMLQHPPAMQNLTKIEVTGAATEYEGRIHVISILYCLKKLEHCQNELWNDDAAISLTNMLLPQL